MNKREQEKTWKHVVREQVPFGLCVLLVGMGVLWLITWFIPLPDHVGSTLGLFGMSWFGLPNWLLIIWTFGVTTLFVACNISDCRGDDWRKSDFLNTVITLFGIAVGIGAAWLTSWHVIYRPDFASAAYNGNLKEYLDFTRTFPIGKTYVVNGTGVFRSGKITFSEYYSLSGTGESVGKVVLVPTANYPSFVPTGTQVTLWVEPPKKGQPLWYDPTPTFVLRSE